MAVMQKHANDTKEEVLKRVAEIAQKHKDEVAKSDDSVDNAFNEVDEGAKTSVSLTNALENALNKRNIIGMSVSSVNNSPTQNAEKIAQVNAEIENIERKIIEEDKPDSSMMHKLFTILPENYGSRIKNIAVNLSDIRNNMKNRDIFMQVSKAMESEANRMKFDVLQDHLKNDKVEYSDEILTQESYESQPMQHEVLYQQNTINTPTGPVKYDMFIEEPPEGKSFETYINNNPDDKIGNFFSLKDLITKELSNSFVPEYIHSVYVVDDELIINNVRRIVNVGGLNIDFNRSFPDDVYSAVNEGNMARLFYWQKLKQMPNLRVLLFSDMNFVSTYVVNDLGWRRNWGVTSFFKAIPSLETLTIGNETVTRDNLDKEDSVPLKESVARNKRFSSLLDGYNLNVYEGTDYLQNFFVNSTKNYMNNRGNKGFLRYALGTAARGIGAVGSVGLNFGVHLFGGVKNIVSDALFGDTTLNESDISGATP